MNSTFWISSFTIIFAVIWGAVHPESLSIAANTAYHYTTNYFGSFYLLSVLLIVIFLFLLALSKYGRVKLGQADEKPQYHFYSWIGMLFSCGFGTGLVFWGIAEPVSHFIAAPREDDAVRLALQYSFFNWGIHQWSVFTIVGLALAYFQFKKNEKGEIGSTLNPLIGSNRRKRLRKAINILAVITTVMGVTTSLGMGILQMNGGLHYLFSIPNDTNLLFLTTVAMMICYLLSAVSGIDRGIKVLSILNLNMALAMLLIVLFLGPTTFIIDHFILGVGDYFKNFFAMSVGRFPFESNKEWSVGYWAWVIAWSPFVGAFIAKISKGRTIREFIFGVLFIPPTIAILWFSVFGGTALYMELAEYGNIATYMQQDIALALFTTFSQFPLSGLLSITFIILIATFLVTSADSAIFILALMTSDGKINDATLLKLFWGVLMAAMVAVLITSSGLQGLQSASLVAALPFTFILLLICFSLVKTLRADSTPPAPFEKLNK